MIRPVLPQRTVLTQDARAKAQAAYEEARRRYAAGEMEAALAAADEAWRAVPNASTALIRATILGKLDRHEEAIGAVLVASDLRPTSKESEAIESLLARHGMSCSPPRGWVRVEVSPEGADVTVHGVRFRGRRTIGMTGGSHLFRLEVDGQGSSEAIVTVTPGRGTTVRLMAGTVVFGGVASQAAPPRRHRGVLPWLLVGGGAAVLGTAIGLNVWALDAMHDRDRASRPSAYLTDEERRARYVEADSAMRKRGISAYVLYGVGGAAVVAGAVLFLLPERGYTGSPAMRPFALGSGAGIAVGGGF